MQSNQQSKINPSKTYKTRSGLTVKDIEISQHPDYPVTAKIMGFSDDNYLHCFTATGQYYEDVEGCDLDLIEVKPKEESLKAEVTQHVHTAPRIHHDLIIAWAKNPNLNFQFKSKCGDGWITDEEPYWSPYYEYRIKPQEPKLLTIIGSDGKARSYPEPCKEPLKEGTYYYVSCVKDITPEWRAIWSEDGSDYKWLNSGIVHLTEEAATQHAKAMLGMD